MSIGQPGVEREHRYLDTEADEHAAEDQQLAAAGDAGTGGVGELTHVERAQELTGDGILGEEEQRQEAEQHQGRAEQRVEEELQRGVAAVVATPHRDHEEHRQQDDLEEDEEEDEVLRHEGADHAGLEDQHEDQERLRVARRRDVVPRVQEDQRHHQHGEGDEWQRHAVDTERVPGADDVDPRLIDHPLELTSLVVVEVEQHRDAETEGDEADRERPALVEFVVVVRHRHGDDRTEERYERDSGEDPRVHCSVFPLLR